MKEFDRKALAGLCTWYACQQPSSTSVVDAYGDKIRLCPHHDLVYRVLIELETNNNDY